MSKGLDTNVIVRYLVRDDLEQWKLADEYIKQVKASGETCFINNIVLCELVWVLKTSYKLSRIEITDVIEKILKTDAFDFENREAALWSLQQMKKGKADFSDYLIGKLNEQAGCSETVTFDAKLQGTQGIRLL
ncbi:MULTISPECIES: PIN domain-containing protein [Fischerella]|uniref:PIN domain-containing protein n=1 Tax=Fischerella muscicola CCMEE 5323 TaxID=2019572 RepID=A0A2N6K6A4_FISMU|nr:type II toxin-antitoxin system VapC family toxin [Fischerella muscicola]MBD2430253.1 type II toxin-antitoxin system VapC family toxin [Fischerella sp. FACHB-380]PLZ92368.1 PIN domain-containing protein [Fischerella muscicola CCMEE 5323]